MAGGFRRGAGIPLKHRARVGQISAPVRRRRQLSRLIVRLGIVGCHCPWTADLRDLPCSWDGGGKTAMGPWVGQVVYAAELRPREWSAVIEWLTEDRLTAVPPV